ncbi:hypothetical protein GGI35DRAFT_456337 [Trichoderma velutinum]
MSQRTSRATASGPRRIAPGPISESASTAAQRPGRLPSRRIGVSVACEACRKRKTRCSGTRPKCLLCSQKGIDCHYTSANANETNSAVLKRKFREVKEKTGDYEEFYEAIQSMPAADSQAIFRLVRQGANIKTVLRQIKEGSLLLQLSVAPETRRRYEFPFVTTMPAALLTADNLYLKSVIYEATFHDNNQQQLNIPLNLSSRTGSPQYIYTQPYHSAEIVNTRLSTVDISRWTAVTTDNELMRALLHAYFLYEYSSYTIFQKDIFIQALTDGNEQFCSSLLVNAVLAEASHCYMGIQHREQFWNPENIGYRFLAEARRLWELQSENADLPTLQAAVIFNGIYVNNGIDKLGLTYLDRAIAIAEHLQLFHDNSNIHDKTLRHARDFTAWCLYKYQTIMGYYYFKTPMITRPPVFALPDPYAEPSWYGDFILKYPANNTFTSLYFPHFFNADTKFKILLNTIATSLYRPENVERTLSANVKSDLRAQMESWLACLSVPLHPSNIVFPAQLRLHMEYHATLMTLLQTPVNSDRSSASISIPNANDNELLQEAISTARVRLETIVRIYYLRHSYEFCNTYLTFFFSNVGFAALEGLRASTVDHERFKHLMSTLILCIKGLYDQGQHVHVASAVYRLLRNRLSPQDLRFLQGYIHWDITEDDSPLIISHVQSEWPLPISDREKDPEAAKLENLARRLNEMSVNSSRETSEQKESETRGKVIK